MASLCPSFAGKPAVMENGLKRESFLRNLWRYLGAGLGFASMQVPQPDKDDFYSLNATPKDLNQYAPGTLLRSRGIYLNDFPGFDAEDLVGWHIAFVTRGQVSADETSQITLATVILPPSAPGPNQRQNVLFLAPKTDSSSPNFRTSYMFRRGSGSLISGASEQIFLIDFLSKGTIVVIVDYEGQYDAFGAGPTGGHCLLDAMRATLAFRDLKLAPKEKLKFIAWGYSGGAIAVTWAHAMLHSYAAELADVVKAWSCGGVPTDLHAVALHVNNKMAAGLIIGVILGLCNIYADLKKWVDDHTSAKGKEMFAWTRAKGFWPVMVANSFKNVLGIGDEDRDETYFSVPGDGDPLSQPLPARVLDENSLTKKIEACVADPPKGITQRTPMFIYQSIEDEVVPITVVDNLVRMWSGLGTCTIDYRRVHTTLHIATIFAMHSQNVEWITKRFAGEPMAPKGEKVNGNLCQCEVKDADVCDEHSKQNLGKKRTEQITSFYNDKCKDEVWWH